LTTIQNVAEKEERNFTQKNVVFLMKKCNILKTSFFLSPTFLVNVNFDAITSDLMFTEKKFKNSFAFF